jgi:hypothetical protein
MDGLVAEWLRRGLQILVSRFDSGRGLQNLSCPIFVNRRSSGAKGALPSVGTAEIIAQNATFAQNQYPLLCGLL